VVEFERQDVDVRFRLLQVRCGLDATPSVAAFRFACKFTGKERDSESGPDYFGARCYGSNTTG
jgi:hypothetical protein